MSGGFTGGALQVTLGGVDNVSISGMSGGWKLMFSLSAATAVSLSLRFRLTQNSQYESDEQSQALVSIDGILVGQTPNDKTLAVVVGDGNGGSEISTGWLRFDVNLGTLSPGIHSLILGGYNSRKDWSDEVTTIEYDDVMLDISKVSR